MWTNIELEQNHIAHALGMNEVLQGSQDHFHPMAYLHSNELQLLQKSHSQLRTEEVPSLLNRTSVFPSLRAIES